MLKLLPDLSTLLRHTHIFKTNIIAELYLECYQINQNMNILQISKIPNTVLHEYKLFFYFGLYKSSITQKSTEHFK